MSDWADRKEQRLISRANEEERERQKQSQILASAKPFWEEMLASMNESKDAWNTRRGRDEIFIHGAGSPTDTLGLIVRGRDDTVILELHYNVPLIKYSVEGTHKIGNLRFDIDHGEVRVYNKAEPSKRYTATGAADFFLDQVVHG